jgi:hypothetical protein
MISRENDVSWNGRVDQAYRVSNQRERRRKNRGKREIRVKLIADDEE